MAMKLELPDYNEDGEVWNRLEDGLQMARDEFRVLDPETRRNLELLGKILSGIHIRLVVDPEVEGLVEDRDSLLENPWIRHATDLEIAVFTVGRASNALDLYRLLQPTVHRTAIPERAQPYLREVTTTFLLGFFPACVALCRATLEQLLKEQLVQIEVYTEPQIKRERPTAGVLMHNAKRTGILTAAYDAADRIVRRGDAIMHRGFPEQRIRQRIALDSTVDLIEVVVEVVSDKE